MLTAAVVVFATLFLSTVALILARGSAKRIDSSRTKRILRLGNLWARLWTSWVGAKLRRLFAGQEARKQLDADQRRKNAERVAETMGQMKGAFMKLGQMLSFVTDDIPEEYRVALASLQAAAPPMDLALLRDVAEKELGKPLERAFARFDAEPIAAASIGQVHRAQLPSGEEVVVKIQYPGVGEAIKADLDNVAVLYRMAMMFYPAVDVKPIVDELRERIGEELDYENEARNQRAFYELYAGHPFIRVPRVIDGYSTKRVLTSEFVPGFKFADVMAKPVEDRRRYAEILYRFIFGSITRYGVFNGDPHPGNYLFDEHGKVVFLDFGCVKYFPLQMRRDWKALVSAHVQGDKQKFLEQLEALSFVQKNDGHDAQVLYDYFSYFYEPFHIDRVWEFTREYNAKSFGMVFKPQGKFAPLSKKLNMPRDFVFVNRIQWGVVSLLAQLGARENWHRIHREFHYDDPPSTELGKIDEQWRRERKIPEGELVLTPEGLKPAA
jgi:predicted unusual protein kinase regulating ubiquinone biosynthesis (AarF/ABC1/UbiB family)